MEIVSAPSAHVQVSWTSEFVGASWMAAENEVTSLKIVIGPMLSSFHCMIEVVPHSRYARRNGFVATDGFVSLFGLGTSS